MDWVQECGTWKSTDTFFSLDKLGQMELRCGLAMGQMLPNPQTPTKEPGHETFQLPASAHTTPFPWNAHSLFFFLSTFDLPSGGFILSPV